MGYFMGSVSIWFDHPVAYNLRDKKDWPALVASAAEETFGNNKNTFSQLRRAQEKWESAAVYTINAGYFPPKKFFCNCLVELPNGGCMASVDLGLFIHLLLLEASQR